jgi:integrase/recombinase XerD
MSDKKTPAPVVVTERSLTPAAFQGLADVPPEMEWFANLGNEATRRAYETALRDFMRFTGIQRPEEFRTVTRAHVIAWRDELARRELSATTVRHRLSALASMFDYMCDKNAVSHNPVKGAKRPVPETTEGKTPALGDHQARKLLDAPTGDMLKAKRDRAILATLLYHALRRDELCKLKVKDYRQERRGVPHLKVSGKGGKTRYVPLHPAASGLIADYLEAAGHSSTDAGPLFRPLHHSRDPASGQAITPDRLRLLRIPKQSRLRGHELRESFTILPELDETCVGIVLKVTLCKSPKTPQLRIVHSQEGEIR